MNTLEDRSVHDKLQWDTAIKFMETTVGEKLRQSECHNHIQCSVCVQCSAAATCDRAWTLMSIHLLKVKDGDFLPLYTLWFQKPDPVTVLDNFKIFDPVLTSN